MADLRISTPEGIWSFYRWRTAPAGERVICLHGFARTGEDFESWGSLLQDEMEILAPDLPHHGNTQWSKEPYDRNTLLKLLDKLCDGKPYWLAGFSFGGRVILSLLHLLPQPPKGIILLAPEGFETERLGVWKRVPNGFRKGLVNWAAKDGRGLRIAKRLNKAGVIDSFSVKFVRKQLEDEQSVQRLLAAWNALHAFPIQLKNIQQYCQQSDCPILLVGSQGDKIVDIQPVARQLQQACPRIELKILKDPGHNQLTRAAAKEVAEWIKSKK